MLIGGFAGMFVARGLNANDSLALGLISFGILLGCIVSGTWFLVRHFCFPEETGK